jgi:hypothetical protein
MDLPGYGADTPQCREPSGFISCPDLHLRIPVRNSCQRVECPHCWTDWASKASRRVSDRLRGVRACIYHEYIDRFPQVKKVRHFVFSPPPGLLKESDRLDRVKSIWKKFQKAERLLHMGVVFYHPYRIRDDVERSLRVYMRERGLSPDGDGYEDGGYWALVRADVLNLGSRDAYIHFSPHYHVLGSGGLPPSDVFHANTSWVYVQLGERHLRMFPDEKTGIIRDEISVTAKYLLSHAGVEKTEKGTFKNSYWYFGYCSHKIAHLVRDSRGKPVIRLCLQSALKCPVCGQFMKHAWEVLEKGSVEVRFCADDVILERKFRKYEVVLDG